MNRLGSTSPSLKLKGIDGDSHKRCGMWFNSMVNEKPHQGLKSRRRQSERIVVRKDGGTGAAWLPSARAVRCTVKSGNERNPCLVLNLHKRLPVQTGGRRGRRQVSMALTPRATRMIQWLVQRVAKPRGGANPKKPVSVRIAGCNSPA